MKLEGVSMITHLSLIILTAGFKSHLNGNKNQFYYIFKLETPNKN